MKHRKAETLRTLLLAAATLVAAGCSSRGGNDDMPQPAGNTAPVVSAITDRSADQDTTLAVSFGIVDRESDVGKLTLTAAADSGNVFPADGVVLGGSGTSRTLTLTPLEAATGTSILTVTLTDPDGASAARTFRVTVNAHAASIRNVALTTFAKGASDDATTVNGFTFDQDADDPAVFQALVDAGAQ
jgi:hypothetical protein